MRIVHLTPSTTVEITGGLEHHVAYLSKALRGLGHEVIVINTSPSTRPGLVDDATSGTPGFRPGSALLPAGVRHRLDVLIETVAMFRRRSRRSRHAKALAEQVERLQPDLVHQHAYIGALRTCWLLSRKYPLVFTNHTGAYLHLDRWAPTRLLQRQIMRAFTTVIAPSRELRPRTANSRYVPNGVETETFFPVSAPERDRLLAKHGCTGKIVFLCPRRWAPTKGVIYLAKALRHLSAETRRQSVFLFAGNETPGYPRYQHNVRRELAKADCEVRVLGNLGHAELAELLNISLACIIPSLMEATSLACLEAMACATPVIGTRIGGLLELVSEGETGWLVPARDEKTLAARINNVCKTDPVVLKRIKKRSVERVRSGFTWAVAARETERIYYAARSRWAQESAS